MFDFSKVRARTTKTKPAQHAGRWTFAEKAYQIFHYRTRVEGEPERGEGGGRQIVTSWGAKRRGISQRNGGGGRQFGDYIYIYLKSTDGEQEIQQGNAYDQSKASLPRETRNASLHLLLMSFPFRWMKVSRTNLLLVCLTARR